MLIKSTSARKYIRAFVICGLYTIFAMFGLARDAGAFEKPNFAEPFKKCRTYGINNGLSQIVASDNESNIVFFIDNNSLTSVNYVSNLENWKTEIIGKLLPEATVSNGNVMFFVSVFENETRQKTFVLNAISLKTGITVWQKRFTEYEQIRIKEVSDKDLLFLVAEDKIILAVQKSDGNINWTKKIQNRINSINISATNRINVLTNDRLLNLSSGTGELLEEVPIKKGFASNSLINEKYLLLGYPTGEFMKVAAVDNRSDVLWKIKTGGSISGLVELENQVLITSLDNFLYLFSVENGKQKWKRRVSGRINIKPLIYDNLAIVLNSNTASVIELEAGKIVNQIEIEEDNYFSGQPFISGNFLIFQTYRGIYIFVNSERGCK